MITTRKGSERGTTRIDWLDSRHSFSFGDYFDEDNMGFHALRVINDDKIAAASGFGTHGHRDMEIVTWMLSGTLEHKDSLGSGDKLRPGDVQRMSAGRGIAHSEWNPSPTEPVHLLQIWIMPDKNGSKPTYDQVHVPAEERRDRWRMLVDGRGTRKYEDSPILTMGADAMVLTTQLTAGRTVEYEPEKDRALWLQVAKGRVRANGRELEAGDALALEREPKLVVEALDESELLLFDLA